MNQCWPDSPTHICGTWGRWVNSSSPPSTAYTARCRYNAVNFLKNYHNRHPIARPLGRGMGCLLWVWNLIYILLLQLQYPMYYRDKLDRVITALHCIRLFVQGGDYWRNLHHWLGEKWQKCISVTTFLIIFTLIPRIYILMYVCISCAVAHRRIPKTSLTINQHLFR